MPKSIIPLKKKNSYYFKPLKSPTGNVSPNVSLTTPDTPKGDGGWSKWSEFACSDQLSGDKHRLHWNTRCCNWNGKDPLPLNPPFFTSLLKNGSTDDENWKGGKFVMITDEGWLGFRSGSGISSGICFASVQVTSS